MCYDYYSVLLLWSQCLNSEKLKMCVQIKMKNSNNTKLWYVTIWKCWLIIVWETNRALVVCGGPSVPPMAFATFLGGCSSSWSHFVVVFDSGSGNSNGPNQVTTAVFEGNSSRERNEASIGDFDVVQGTTRLGQLSNFTWEFTNSDLRMINLKGIFVKSFKSYQNPLRRKSMFLLSW